MHTSDLARRFILEIWQENRLDQLPLLTTPDFIDHAYNPGTIEGHRKMAQTLRLAIPDATWSIERLTCEGDIAVAELRLTGHQSGPFRDHPPSGKPVDARQYRTFRFVDGKLAEHWALFDTATLLRQIAH
ncbi:ester cyclase [Lacibacterium aquatile]|uniref:Ester cyclase n=1 Tax=Lacibacterium aquatile TaxID=1168082 RepID=A0ABW5DRJ5_9PROT